MSADRPFDTKHIRDLTHHLARIATATERIADALDTMNANDPLTAIGKALEVETQTAHTLKTLTDAHDAMYGAELPKSEKWRMGS